MYHQRNGTLGDGIQHNGMQLHLCQKIIHIYFFNDDRKREIENLNEKLKALQMTIDSLHEDLQEERGKSHKKTSREVS